MQNVTTSGFSVTRVGALAGYDGNWNTAEKLDTLRFHLVKSGAGGSIALYHNEVLVSTLPVTTFDTNGYVWYGSMYNNTTVTVGLSGLTKEKL